METNKMEIDKIDRIELIGVRIPLVAPFETSFGVQSEREALLLRITSGGADGWGECVAGVDPFYSYETNATVSNILKGYLVPMLQKALPTTIAEILLAFDRVRGHRMAKATIENALLDLVAKRGGLPLYRLLGGVEKRIMSGISLGIQDDIGKLLRAIENAIQRKYGRIKIKIKKGRDLDVLREVRRQFPDIRLMADANSDYTLDDLPLLKTLDAFALMMIEQPLSCDDIYEHSLLQKELKTPLCLDESIHSLKDAETAADLGSCRIINIKQGRVGGMLAAAAIQKYCLSRGIPVWSGGMLETGIGRAFNIHLQTLPGFTLPGDTSETSRYFREEIVDPAVVLDADGMIAIPPGPGIGVAVSDKLLNKYNIYHETIRS